MTTTVKHPTAEEHVKRFKETHSGKGLSEKQIEDICTAIRSAQTTSVVGEVAPYYKANLISALFYINVMINCFGNTPARFKKSFVGHCGGLAIPGDSLFESCELHTCDPYTFEDIFNKQEAIEVDAESITCFIRFFDNKSNLLGWLWGAGAGSVIGVMGGKGKWKDGPL
ncbi:MAG: VapA/VapB family virulence-associated protein [Syntrophomonadaceae bacterium]|nr:VapA/VapB family virulence-associated protein [Syntrophomonadaceae bacterium]